MPLHPGAPRFLQLVDVAEILNISEKQVYALVRRGELKAVKIGGRGVWRVEEKELEAYIERLYADTKSFIDSHPYAEPPEDALDGVDRVDGVEPEQVPDPAE